ncbi:MAG: CDP-diacylglycerol--serine O-phosphatidyltransferase [Gemmatimonadota bacterium]
MTPPRASGRETLQRGVIILPSAFTLGNLFFGIYALIATARGDLLWAGWFIIYAGVLDMLDGRIARFTRTGSRFGAELDSLVDAISFGVAPAFIIYAQFFTDSQWSWTLAYVYVTAVVVRLARFNVEQAGEAKRYFHGLPSPAAGMLLASFYPFSQTPFFQFYLGDWPWHRMMGMGVVLIGMLMVSHVPYAPVPRIGLKTRRGIFNTIFILACLFAALTIPRYFFFTFLLLYAAWGLIKSVLLGLLDRLPGGDPLLDDEESDGEDRAEVRSLDYADLRPGSAAERNYPTEEEA